MTEKDDKIREIWKEMDLDLQEFLGNVASSEVGKSLTPEIRERIQNSRLQDITEQEGGN